MNFGIAFGIAWLAWDALVWLAWDPLVARHPQAILRKTTAELIHRFRRPHQPHRLIVI
jgi:hypothetical protein